MNTATAHADLPDAQAAELAHGSATALARLLQSCPKQARARVHMQGTDLILPRKAVELLRDILTEMAQGNAVTLMPLHAEITTQEAANLLNVSRPYLIKLLEEGAIPFTKIGTHRRVRLQDVMHYRAEQQVRSQEALKALADLAQQHDMGY